MAARENNVTGWAVPKMKQGSGPTVTSHFGIDPWALFQAGALNVPLDGPDAHVYLDPRLLRKSAQPEFQGAMEEVVAHYGEALTRIAAAGRYSGEARKRVLAAAKERFVAPELEGLRIGHSVTGSGQGLGSKRAAYMVDLAKGLLEDGLQDPILLEVFSVVEKGIGADLISDLMAHITKDRFFDFSQRVAKEVGLETREFETGSGTYDLPWNPLRNERLVLPPHDAVADLLAFGKSQRFDSREFDNKGIREAFDKIVKEKGLQGIRAFIKEHPEEQAAFLDTYQKAAPAPHDIFNDPQGVELAGKTLYEAIAPRHQSGRAAPTDAHSLFVAILNLVELFQKEARIGTFRRQLHSSKGPRNEKTVQDVFRIFVHLACRDLDIKVSPEPDPGVGPTDFVFDLGASAVVVLEMKLSKGSDLVPNYDHQVRTYRDAHGAHHAIYMVIDLVDHQKNLQKLVAHHHSRHADPARPYLIIVDGRQTATASKQRSTLPPLPDVSSQPLILPAHPARVAPVDGSGMDRT